MYCISHLEYLHICHRWVYTSIVNLEWFCLTLPERLSHYICINMGKLYYSLLNEVGGNCREQRIPDRDSIWCTQIHLLCVLIMLHYLFRKLYLFCAHITYVLGTHTVIHVSGVHIALLSFLLNVMLASIERILNLTKKIIKHICFFIFQFCKFKLILNAENNINLHSTSDI
jgi:hypothetical protein